MAVTSYDYAEDLESIIKDMYDYFDTYYPKELNAFLEGNLQAKEWFEENYK